MRFLLIAFLFIGITACTATRSQRAANVLDPLVGHHLSEVADLFGPPSVNFATSDGLMTFEWDHSGAGQSGGGDCRILISTLPTYGDPTVTPPTDLASWIVKSWHAYGSGCQ